MNKKVEFQAPLINESKNQELQKSNQIEEAKNQIIILTNRILKLVNKFRELEIDDEFERELQKLSSERQELVENFNETNPDLLKIISSEASLRILWGNLKDHFLEEPTLNVQLLDEAKETFNTLKEKLSAANLNIQEPLRKLPIKTMVITSKNKPGLNPTDFEKLVELYRY